MKYFKNLTSVILIILSVSGIVMNFLFITEKMDEVRRLEFFPVNSIYHVINLEQEYLNEQAHNLLGIDTSYAFELRLTPQNIVRNKFDVLITLIHSDQEYNDQDLATFSKKFKKLFKLVSERIKSKIAYNGEYVLKFYFSIKSQDFYSQRIPIKFDEQ